MEYNNIFVQRDGAAVTITLNRPKVLNAMSIDMWNELHSALLEIKENSKVKVVVLRAAGGRAFSAGTDLKSSADVFSTEIEKAGQVIHGCCRDLMQIPQPVICVVQGYCFGAGLELMVACDYVIATEESVFSMPEMNVGLPCMVEAALLVPAVGLLKAKEMCYFAWNYDAYKAERMGLVNEVVKAQDLEARVSFIIHELTGKDFKSLATQKDIIYKWLTTDLEAAMQYSILAMKLVQGTNAQREGMKAALEKRKIRFE